MTRLPFKPLTADEVAAEIREAIGAGPDDVSNIVTPQFERPAHEPRPATCPSAGILEAMKTMGPDELRAYGLRPWNDPRDAGDEFDGATLWLLPGEWYASLPEGLEFTVISGRKEVFKRGESDNDIRFGCLPYGILVPRPQ